MMRAPHENVATVLVDPSVLPDLELELMELDLRVWPIATAPSCADGPRRAFQVRHRLIEAQRGRWDCASAWVPVWVTFGERWRWGDEPLPWVAHKALWDALDRHAAHVRFHRRLGGVRPLVVPEERAS
ncbi:MAG TPA: hypothetical protein VNS81_04310 [Nocardioides sp.]|nr:hypothetical protein [Nocardioides sp.]